MTPTSALLRSASATNRKASPTSDGEPAPLADRPRPRLHRPDSAPSLPARRRAIWHQRLIEAEGGVRLALRSSSTLYFHLFSFSIVGVTCTILGISALEWLLILAALLATVAAEMFDLAIRNLVEALSPTAPGLFRRTLRLSTAATLTTIGMATLVSAGIIGLHFWRLFE
jgi:diacylglycerol kinase